jgi:Leucine-rich repeat (LRR) protein
MKKIELTNSNQNFSIKLTEIDKKEDKLEIFIDFDMCYKHKDNNIIINLNEFENINYLKIIFKKSFDVRNTFLNRNFGSELLENIKINSPYLKKIFLHNYNRYSLSINYDLEPDFINNLETLHISNSDLNSIPERLPLNLKQLDLTNNNISTLSSIKYLIHLETFKISFNKLNLINHPMISHNLKHLEANNCKLSSNNLLNLIINLENLKILKVCNNNISNLNLSYFFNLKILNCNYNRLSKLDDLPTQLEILKCVKNNITVLDNLPSNLYYLNCSYNKITNLDNLPSGLEILECRDNLIFELNFLPQSIQKLDISNNPIKSLNDLPSSLSILVIKTKPLPNLENLPIQLNKLKVNGKSIIKSFY